MAANFGRAVADRLTKIGAGETLRLAFSELAFAGSCLIVCLGGLSWSLTRASRTATPGPVASELPREEGGASLPGLQTRQTRAGPS